MMDRTWVFVRGVDPRFEYLEDEDVVFGYHLPIEDLAFEIRIAFVDERCLDARG